MTEYKPEAKVWGLTVPLAILPTSEVHLLHISAGGYSSIHKHKKWNRFCVLKGCLRVELFSVVGSVTPWRTEYSDLDAERTPIYDVTPGRWHRFRAQTECAVIEVYWMDQIDSGDIVRITEGGMEP